ncbi:MAG: N-acetyltransferase [Actinomycetota bacterium]|nr:N-acetyltransferase [Actinomycetota bacterium]
MAEDAEPRVSDNPSDRRYELRLADRLVGVIAYRPQPGAVVLIHTVVDPAFEGRGFGSRLAAGALDDIRARGLSVVPLCPFVASYLRRHPEYADLAAHDPALTD